MEDANNRGRLAKLIRFHTTTSPTTLVSLDDYAARMKAGQNAIYFICGGSMDEVQRSPFLEKLLEHGYEVLLFTEPMDEYMMQVRCCHVKLRAAACALYVHCPTLRGRRTLTGNVHTIQVVLFQVP